MSEKCPQADIGPAYSIIWYAPPQDVWRIAMQIDLSGELLDSFMT
jgi:hypothetical protein